MDNYWIWLMPVGMVVGVIVANIITMLPLRKQTFAMSGIVFLVGLTVRYIIDQIVQEIPILTVEQAAVVNNLNTASIFLFIVAGITFLLGFYIESDTKTEIVGTKGLQIHENNKNN